MCSFLKHVLLPAAEGCDLPSSLTPTSPATSDAQSQSSHTAGSGAEPASEPEAASAVQPEADVSRLERFLHTVTTADEVLNDLLGELSRSSSSPAQLSRQSSTSALLNLAGEQSNDVTSANSDACALASPADGALLSSSSAQQVAAGIHASSSSAALYSDIPHSELQSPRSTTGVVLDTLLEDLRSAELSRQSSSSVLLSRLTSLAEMHRRSASSSPVAGTSQADMLRQPSSSSELPLVAVNCDSADPNGQSASSHSEEPTCSISRSSSSSPIPLAASQHLPSSSFKAFQQPDEEDGQDYASAAPVVKKHAADAEEVVRAQTSATRDLVLDELLAGAQAPPFPESSANKVKATL